MKHWSANTTITCSKTSCCEYKLYLQDRVLFKYNETLQTWMLVLCKENTLSCVQCQKLSISFRFLNLLKILIIDGTAEGLQICDYKAKSANFFDKLVRYQFVRYRTNCFYENRWLFNNILRRGLKVKP